LALLLSSGVFVGALLSYFLLKKEISVKYVPISVIFMTLFIVDLSFSAKYVHLALTTNIALSDFLSTFSGIKIIIDVFAYSVFAGLYIVPLITLLQVLANRKIRARVFATNAIVNVLFMIAGSSVCFLFIKMGLAFPIVLTIIALFNVCAAI
jgi:acyl-[acyl-carrier-protein]-phospholipid O-acyltransferase/long-chain-fatty-acid--[acyl-carrier-protein] ligase